MERLTRISQTHPNHIEEYEEEEFPRVTEEFIEALEKQFPDRSPKLTDTDREIWASVGRAEVVQFLRTQHNNGR